MMIGGGTVIVMMVIGLGVLVGKMRWGMTWNGDEVAETESDSRTGVGNDSRTGTGDDSQAKVGEESNIRTEVGKEAARQVERVLATWKDTLRERAEEAERQNGTAQAGAAQKDGGVQGGNCTLGYGNLVLINPNFRVDTAYIAGRKSGLISLSQTYGIPEYKAGNGDNLMVPEAAEHLAAMIRAYEAENPGHTMGTRSCFRERGTTCGRLCAATGTSDHHTGLTCDLIDNAYGTDLNTDDYGRHLEWQWLRANSYKYGFIDRFPEEWAGGLMTEPLNVNAEGSTGLFETWHYRYVGVDAAAEIAQGKYNNGRYDSLEHYLKATGRVVDLVQGVCSR